MWGKYTFMNFIAQLHLSKPLIKVRTVCIILGKSSDKQANIQSFVTCD